MNHTHIIDYIQKIENYCKSNNLWNIPRKEAEYLFELIKTNKFTNILECGTGGGYSTLWLAYAASFNNGKVLTIESHKERYNNANAIFQNSGLTNIAQIKGHCPGYFENLNEKFDFIFIDVVKHLYLETFKKSVNLLKANGIIAADNIKTHKAETAEFIEYLLALADYKTEIIDVGNGLSITSKKEHIVFLGLGANIAPELENIRQALKQLENNPNIKILQKSSIYISEPIGYTEQPEFYNCALKIKTEFKPLELLEFIKKIEKELCRVSSEIHWGPRTIDVDILLYDDLILETENLTIPHKELTNRRFAIEPLLEIEPQIFYPNKDINLTNLYFSEKIQRQKVKKLNILW